MEEQVSPDRRKRTYRVTFRRDAGSLSSQLVVDEAKGETLGHKLDPLIEQHKKTNYELYSVNLLRIEKSA